MRSAQKFSPLLLVGSNGSSKLMFWVLLPLVLLDADCLLFTREQDPSFFNETVRFMEEDNNAVATGNNAVESRGSFPLKGTLIHIQCSFRSLPSSLSLRYSFHRYFHSRFLPYLIFLYYIVRLWFLFSFHLLLFFVSSISAWVLRFNNVRIIHDIMLSIL